VSTGRFETALAELAAVVGAIDRAELAGVAGEMAAAGRIMLYGCGREGLMLRALAMRLHHLGLDVSMQGDMAAPPLGPGDLFLASAGPGELSTVSALAGQARKAGARVLMLTAEPAGASCRLADRLLVIPAQTMARDIGGASVLPMGSLFEGAMFLTFEILVLELADRLGATPAAMRARHTNME
jgi:6-phospho-3-hexuloisomerase